MTVLIICIIVGCLVQVSTQSSVPSNYNHDNRLNGVHYRKLFPGINNALAYTDSQITDNDNYNDGQYSIQVRAGNNGDDDHFGDDMQNPLDGTSLSAFVPFIVDILNEIKNSKDLTKKFKEITDGMLKEFTSDKYPDSMIPNLVSAVNTFFNKNPIISAELLMDVAAKMVKQQYKKPESVYNNARKIRNKSAKGLGSAISAGGDTISSAVRLGKDLHNAAVDTVTSYTDNLPLVGTAVRFATGAGRLALSGLEVGSKYTGRYVGGTIFDWADQDEAERKEEKLIRKIVEKELRNRRNQLGTPGGPR